MIPDRAPAPRTHDLTMLRYQQMPMIPQRPSNTDQRRLVAATQNKSPAQSMPKKIGRPRGPVKVKCADPRKQAGETLSRDHAKRIKKQVEELFKHGPLTVAMVQRALKLSIHSSGGRKIFDWKNRGLIVEVEGPKVGDGNQARSKWWGLKPTETAAGGDLIDSARG